MTMAMNKIQFQAGMSLHEFLRHYGTEEQCEAALFTSRWPQGWKCLRCDGKRYSCTYNGRRLWECLGCGYQCSSIVGTVFENTKLPLTIWFLAIYLMTQSKNAVSALELKRQLGVSYKTAWSIKHKLLQTILLREEQRRLDGRVEIDDAYLGGEKQGKRGRGAASKTPFVAAIQTNSEGKPHFMRLTPVAGFTHEAHNSGRANAWLLLRMWYPMVYGASKLLLTQLHSMNAMLLETVSALCSAPNFIGSTRYLAISRLRSAEHTMHLITPSMHIVILQSFLIVSIAALIWLLWCRDCCVPLLLQILFHSIY
jgi:transposase-like protein